MAPGTSPPRSSLRNSAKRPFRHTPANSPSRQAISKYLKANNDIGSPSDAMFKARFNGAIRKGLDNGDFTFPKGEFYTFASFAHRH